MTEVAYFTAVENLGINLTRLWQQLLLEEADQEIVCQMLLGESRRDVAARQAIRQCCDRDAKRQAAMEKMRPLKPPTQTQPPLSKKERLAQLPKAEQEMLRHLRRAEQQIGDRLNRKIYPAFAQLMAQPQSAIAGNWTKILSFLCDPQQGFRLTLPPQLNSDHFQSSLGRQVFLSPPDHQTAQAYREATQFYQRGLYYQAFRAFATAWQLEQQQSGCGNPEILIYLNNCLVELYRDRLQPRNLPVYQIAVVVPFHHNQGRIAAEVLRGVAQLQWQTNWQSLQGARLERELHGLELPAVEGAVGLVQPLMLQLMVVNDPNHIYDIDSPTAERLAELAPELNLMAVIGHYSSEMTEKALPLYALRGLPLMNASSTSDRLSTLSAGLQQCLFRLTTPDQHNAAALLRYLAATGIHRRKPAGAPCKDQPQTIALMYNCNSQYCLSYRAAVRSHLAQHPESFRLLSECDRLSHSPLTVHRYLQEIEGQADILLVIPDGGLEPNSLNNAGLISRLGLKQRILAGPATLQQENLLHWMYERELMETERAAVVACVPWHERGIRASHPQAEICQQFCLWGQGLWGQDVLTWRSAVAYDALLMIKMMLALQPCFSSAELLKQLDCYFRIQQKTLIGTTGKIRFGPGCDRLNPPTEIVTVRPEPNRGGWIWDVVEPANSVLRCASQNV